jgi:PAS domain S-box-containing protein
VSPAQASAAAAPVVLLVGRFAPPRDRASTVDALRAAGMLPVEMADEGREAFEPPASVRPAVVVVGDAVAKPVALARRIERALPGVPIVFLRGRETDVSALAYSAPPGASWRTADDDSLAGAVRDAVAVQASRPRLRTTLDRINLQLGNARAMQGAEYRRLVISDHFLASVLRAVDDAIVSLDRDGIVLSWNAAAERLFGRERAAAVGRPIGSVARWRTDIEPLIERQAAGTEAGRSEVAFERDGETVHLDASFTAIRDDAGGVMAVAGILRDVTATKRADQERAELLAAERAARGDAERASRLKDEFLSVLSHELRTPLGAIVGYAHVLDMMPGLPEEARRGVAVIARNARAQQRIISDLLDMSSIAAGKLRLELQHLEPSAVVEAALESLAPTIEAKRVHVAKTLEAAGPVLADPHRLQQVVWNLVSNAVKFSPPGGRVGVSLRRVDSHVEIVVSDEGEGISPDFLPHVFDRFRQQDASTTRRHGGLGLGLAIVRQLVELHGGTIRALSEGAGKGATFVVALPLVAVQAEGMERAAPDIAPPRLESQRILVVDDEPDARSMLLRLLESYGAVVEAASSAAEALGMLEARGYDVLVSDIGMPHMDGYELIRRVRASCAEEVRRIPALALTAFTRSEDRRRALLAGYQMHVGKPVDPAELVTMVSSLARRG